jgi:hypothetical protein
MGVHGSGPAWAFTIIVVALMVTAIPTWSGDLAPSDVFKDDENRDNFDDHHDTVPNGITEPVGLIENLGQLDDEDVLLYSSSGDMSVDLLASEMRLTLVNGDIHSSITFSFPNSNLVEPIASGRLPSRMNYLVGRDGSKWVRGACLYSEAIFEDLWDDRRDGVERSQVLVHSRPWD